MADEVKLMSQDDMDALVRESAELVLAELRTANPQMEFDPAIIAVIIEVIKILLPLLVEKCGVSAGDAPAVAKRVLLRETIWDRIQYRRARRALKADLGGVDYEAVGGDRMLDAALRAASTAPVETMVKLYWSID